MTLKERINLLSNKKQHTILSASLVLGITFSISAVLGFLRSRFLNNAFFATEPGNLDVYIAAFRVPDLIFKLLVTGALSASFIPIFSSYLHKDKEEANKLASAVISLLLILFTVISVIVLVFTRPICEFITGGFSPDQVNLMISLTRILLIAQIFFLISNFLTGILQVHQVFIVPALSPIIYNIFIILSIFTLTPTFGIYGPVYGAVIGAFFHLAIQIPVVKKQGFRFSPNFNFGHQGVKDVVRLMIPRSLSLGLGEIENTVTLFFTSSLAPGSVVLLNLALQLMYLPSRIFGTTVGQASLPMLSKNIARNELNTFRDTVNKIILQSLYIALPITVLVLVHRLSIVRITFGSKQFPWSATLLTAKTLAYLTPAIVSQAVIQILIRSFYAMHDTKTPLKVSAFSLVTNVFSGYYFINYTDFGIVGLAVSASLGNLVQSFGLLYFYIRKVDGFEWNKLTLRFGKICLSSVIMGIASWLSIQFLDLFILDTSKTINVIFLFGFSAVFSAIIYFGTSRLLKIEEYSDYERYFIKFKRLIFN